MVKAHAVMGITLVKAPGGGLVLVQGPIELSKAKSLSPVWTREVKETRPRTHLLQPDKENGRRKEVIAPTLLTVGKVRVHGESAGRAAARANAELSKMLDGAVRSLELPLEVLEALVPPAEVKEVVLPKASEKDAAIQAERAMGFIGLPDAEVRKRLLVMGRRKSDIDRYIAQRKELAA